MKSSLLRNFFLLFLFSLPVFSYADAQDDEVAAWAQTTLLNTLTVNYDSYEEDIASNRINYTQNARDALRGFLGNYLSVIEENQLSLHPQALGNAQIINEGYFSGIHFWRINQAIAIPELSIQIAFSIVVVKVNGDPPYLVQSVSMIKQPYP
ncbi:hypothetical protein GH742_13420 [Legionella sp. MW5194]|uniref:DotI/IcmL/TraM family protein n=1 Tax=Legionella sp. MW5194 TaxID=2662448 RepID=UPI00193CCAEE|nr:DotI/IcmL/TraM family protein [Legionella sp. MW5194]QRN04776.1 hypothetical protein GH742_13420 [Legionella sp. MW5194]